MSRGHVEISGVGACTMAQGAVHPGKAVGPPGAEKCGRPWKDLLTHVGFALRFAHHVPGQPLVVRTHGADSFGVVATTYKHKGNAEKG